MNHLKVYRLVILMLVILFGNTSFAQLQNNQWRFGFNSSIDFNTTPASFPSGAALPTIQLPLITGNQIEGSASIADKNTGELLFYTDGVTVWNALNQPMPNGSNLGGSDALSSFMAAVIVPLPGSCNKYYVFCIDDYEEGCDGITYSVVDMDLDNGLGDVVAGQKTIPLYDNDTEVLLAYPKPSGDGFWIVSNGNDVDNATIAAFEVTAQGVNSVPVLSPIIRVGSARLNYQGNTLVCSGPYTDSIGTFLGFNMYSFNAATGQISNPVNVPFITPNLDLLQYFEFSFDGNFLYAGGNNSLFRFDLNAGNLSAIAASATQISFSNQFDPHGAAQFGPDGNLYYVIGSRLFRIENPGNPPASIGPIVELPSDVAPFYALPQWNYLLPEQGPQAAVTLTGDSCLQTTQLFSVSDESSITSIQWNFGDAASGNNNTSTLVSPSHTFSGSGNFTVSAIVNYTCGADTVLFPVEIINCLAVDNPCVTFDLGDTLTVCGNDTVQLQADLSGFANITGLQWSGGAGVFIPSDTVASPRYVPTAAERAQGSLNLILQVNATSSTAGQGGRLIAYDHLSEDLIFYISTLDGSIDTIQDNAGDDWIATGFESASSTLYGVSVFAGLGSVNTQTGVETPITLGYQENIFSGEYDNVNGIFYAVGAPPQTTPDPVNQQLYTVNTTTGALTVVGNLNLFTNSASYYGTDEGINGLAYDPAGNVLYGISFTGNLYRINVNDASTTLIGPSQGDCRGLAYDASTQKLWAINSNATLYEIDKNSGTVLATVPCQENFNFITSLTYAPEPFVVEEFNCTDTLQIIFAPDNFLNLGNDTLLCNTPQFTLSQPGLSNYLWQDGSEAPQFTANASGTFSLQATSAAGCIDSDTISIQFVEAAVTATATPQSILLGDTVQLSATGSQNYLWTPDDELSCSNCAAPMATPSETTTYIVTAIDSNGCRSSDTLRVEVDIRCNEPFIPTIFSPNGKGPQANETFCVLSDCVAQFKLVIHNRWGERIFESEDINTCWDGTYKGVEVATGVYAFNVYLKRLDGTLVNKIGNISLVR